MTAPQGNTLKPTTGAGSSHQTEKQQAASQRNFASFQLKGMLSNLHFVHGQVPEANYEALKAAIEAAQVALKGDFPLPCPAGCTRIEDWTLTGMPGFYRLHGRVYGHKRPDIQDTDLITTSFLEVADEAGNAVLTRSGTRYALGKPNSGHVERFPDAATRIFQLKLKVN